MLLVSGHSLWPKILRAIINSVLNITKCSAPIAESFLTTTSSPGRFFLALEVGREKALASAGHMTTKHPEFVGVLN